MDRLTHIFEIAASLHHGDDQRLLRQSRVLMEPPGSRALLHDVVRICHLFCGFPKVVRALNMLHQEFGPADQDALRMEPDEAAGQDGQAIFDRVYGTDAGPVTGHLSRVDQTFLRWTLDHCYGTTFGHTSLTLVERERLTVVALAGCGCWQQARSHIRACLRHGASAEELLGDLERVDWLNLEQQDLAATCIHTENQNLNS